MKYHTLYHARQAYRRNPTKPSTIERKGYRFEKQSKLIVQAMQCNVMKGVGGGQTVRTLSLAMR
jgi:DNA-binding winged helix-turn-helix (wHTH) protein